MQESHFLDFKRELGSSPQALKETARDLASFGLDGGVLIVGVGETSAGIFTLSPIPLQNASERAEQIADNRPEPSLHVRSSVIASVDRPGYGYLVIEVPPSPGAPHMVDGRYYGRSERTKRQLSDAEVVRLHAARKTSESVVYDALAQERDRQPLPIPSTTMFLVAEPLAAPAGIGRALVRGELRGGLELISAAEAMVPERVASASPNPHELNASVRRAKGIALTNLANGRVPHQWMSGEDPTDIELQVSGSVRVLVSRLSYTANAPRIAGEVPFLIDDLPVAWAFRIIGYAARLAEVLPYRGPWGFGIGLDGLDGLRAHTGNSRFNSYQLPVYDEETYEAVTLANSTEIVEAPHQIAERLVGDLVHAFGIAGDYDTILDGTASA